MLKVLREVRRVMTPLTNGQGSGVVAVSGGADSVALLRALCAVHTGPITVAHVNHQLRAEASDADEAFVRELAASLNLPCRVKTIDVAAKAIGANLEATARQVRYEFFAEVAKEVGAVWVATGHTANDQAETVLHRLVRGTGLQGLRGIASVLTNPTIIRPLLTITRDDVIEYLASIDQPFREDASNVDPRFTRNRIRHELLPLLETFNPDVVTALGRLAEQAGEAFAVLEADGARLLAEAELPRAGNRVILDVTKLLVAHPYRVREVIRLLWQREQWPTSEMSADHWTRVVAVARGDLSAADFPDGVTARHVNRVVQIGRRE